MNCPRCGHPCSNHHGDHGCYDKTSALICECYLSEAAATRAAQRQAAAVTVRELDHSSWSAYRRMMAGYSTTEYERLRDRMIGYKHALRDLGLSKRPATGKGKEE